MEEKEIFISNLQLGMEEMTKKIFSLPRWLIKKYFGGGH